MFSLSRLFGSAPQISYARKLYIAIVAQSRNPFFYNHLNVPDTIDGRFDLIVLHLFLLMQRLRQKNSPEAAELSRCLSEALFDDMDRSLREMGVGDTSVGKRIRHMADAFYGRMRAYEEAWHDDSALQHALKRNLYGEVEVAAEQLKAISVYMKDAMESLSKQPVEGMVNAFPFLQLEHVEKDLVTASESA